MYDIQFLASEAHKIHDWFQSFFYVLVTTLLVLGVFFEYFKLPLGGMPSFATLIGRAIIAVILLHSYPEISNLVADLSRELATKLGDLNHFKLVLNRLGDKVDAMTWSWTSVRASLVVAISYLCFFLLYFSVHVAHALYLYTIVVLYVFSPILIALFCLPATARATSALYRSLIEASLWQPVWCVIATLLWSAGVSQIQGDTSHASLLTSVCFCIIAAGSLIMTPFTVHALAGGGLSVMAQSVGTLGIDGILTLTPKRALSNASRWTKVGYNSGLDVAERLSEKPLPKLSQQLKAAPRFIVSSRPSVMRAGKKSDSKPVEKKK